MVTQARDKVFPALVNIKVVTVSYWGGKESKASATGSGTIISPEGYVVTNQHVTSDGKKFRCTLADRQEVSAELVGEDPLTDLAVLKLNLSELNNGGRELSTASFGDSDTLVVGDMVMAMGSPFSLSRSVTLGIVSNTERVFVGGDELEEKTLDHGERTGIFTRWIQHDALINPGNSGGPLVNLRGEVIGVNELGGTGMGFAIPSSIARDVADQLIKHGEVPRSWSGLSFKQIKNTGLTEGVLITSVVQDGPAGTAGLQAGDVVLAIDGVPITVRFPEEIPPLLRKLASLPIGSTVVYKYDRRGAVNEAKVITEPLKRERGDETVLRQWGLSIQEITEPMLRERRFAVSRGVLVTGVRAGGPAALAEPALAPGDIVVAIDRATVDSLSGATGIFNRVMKTDPLPEFVLVEFDRQGKRQVTLVKPKPPKREDPPREVPKGWLGVATQPVLKDLAKQLGHPDQQGFRVTRVYPETTAAAAGMRIGDVILAINGDPVRPKGMQDAGLLQRRVRQIGADEPTTFTILRDGATTELKLNLDRTRIGPDEARRDENRDFELTVRELTFFDRDDEQWDSSVQGVLVEQAEPAGWAGLAGLSPGDLIQRIGDMPITDLATYRAAMEAIAKAQPERVVFVVLRGARTHFRFAEPDWKPVAGKPSGEP